MEKRFYIDESDRPYEKIDDPELEALVEEISTKIAAETISEHIKETAEEGV